MFQTWQNATVTLSKCWVCCQILYEELCHSHHFVLMDANVKDLEQDRAQNLAK